MLVNFIKIEPANMKHIKMLSVFFTLCLISVFTSAQNKMQISLSNHTFSSQQYEIGVLKASEPNAVFIVKGKNAKAFTIKGNKLSISSEYVRPDVKWYDITIEAVTGSGKNNAEFRVVNDQFIKNGVIAHRGAWKNTGASENSIAALQHAIKLGCHGSEFDVHMSADSALVVNHDPHIQGLKIDSVSGKELGKLKLSSGENMPTLESYLKEGLKQNTTKLVLEIKPTTNKERALQVAQKVMLTVEKMKAQAWIDYISFDYEICKELKRLDPYARVAYLNGDKSPAILAADKLWGYDYHFNILKKNESWIKEARHLNLTTNVWTVNDPEMLKWFLDQNIDFITTNEPEMLLKMVNK